MRIKVLGCYGTEFLIYKSCGFLVNESVMLDAGCIVSELGLEQQGKIRDVFVTHAHLDHIKDIFFLANNLLEEGGTIRVRSSEQVVQSLKRHFINGVISPDFTSIPIDGGSILSLEAIDHGVFYPIADGIEVRAETVDHSVAAVGYILKCKNGHVVYTGDTGPTDGLWRICNDLGDIRALFIECSFPNAQQRLASLTGHLTPKTLASELRKLKGGDCPVYIFHMKPQYLDAIEQEIRALGDERITILTQGEEFLF